MDPTKSWADDRALRRKTLGSFQTSVQLTKSSFSAEVVKLNARLSLTGIHQTSAASRISRRKSLKVTHGALDVGL